MTDQQESQNQMQHEFSIMRIYIKDLSYESPNTPGILQSVQHPQIELNLQTNSSKISEDIYEVILQVTVTAKIEEKTTFLVELKQAGVFTIKGFAAEEIDHMCGSFCPATLFPYAREIISETISRGGFPPLYLAPINFDAMYQESKKQQPGN